MTQEEHNLQVACVRWFSLQYPSLAPLLFAVPNGGARSKATAGKLKAEGVVPGVADLILLVPQNLHQHDEYEAETYHALCIEMKTPKGRQSPEQGLWQLKVEEQGYRYVVVRSFDEFKETIENYLA